MKTALAGLAGLASASAVARAADLAAGSCNGRRTPPQTEGPFYPVADQADKDNDLTRVRGRPNAARGEVIVIVGQVTDVESCEPVAGALVEIWQACASGKYNHPGDDNTAPLDEDFQYWGRALTDSQGRYAFRTILPGAYPADSTWIRPPHVHYKVHKKGYRELTTQMYFAGQAYNDTDRILKSLSEADQREVLVEFRDGRGRFDLKIRKV